MHLPRVELAAFTGSHDIGGVGDCSGPVESLSEHVAHKGARRSVVTVDAGVDFPDQLLALGNGDASLQNARGTALVQFIVDQDEGLGSPGNALYLSAVRG